MQQNASPHVRQSDEAHDDQGADEVALGPCFDNELLWPCGFWHDFSTAHEMENGTHGVCENFRIWECAKARKRARSDVTSLLQLLEQ